MNSYMDKKLPDTELRGMSTKVKVECGFCSPLYRRHRKARASRCLKHYVIQVDQWAGLSDSVNTLLASQIKHANDISMLENLGGSGGEPLDRPEACGHAA